MNHSSDEKWMRLALAEAERSVSIGEVPIGCVIVRDETVLANAHNLRENLRDVSAHAEILALREAGTSLNSWRLDGAKVYVTLEPCPMCAAALQQARVAEVIFAASDPKAGAVHSTDHFFEREGLNHLVRFRSGVLETEASEQLKKFFREKRERNRRLNEELGGRAARRKKMKNEGASLKTEVFPTESE